MEFKLIYRIFLSKLNNNILFKRLFIYVLDAFNLCSSIYFSLLIYLNIFDEYSYKNFISFSIFQIIFLIPTYLFTGQYKSVIRYINSQFFYINFLRNLFFVLVVSFINLILIKELIPFNYLVINLLFLLFSTSLSRFLIRDYLTFYQKQFSQESKRTLIYGAGSAGSEFLSASYLEKNINVVGFIDDDENLLGRRIKGKTIYNLNQVFLFKEKIDQIIIAIPSCSKQRIIEIINDLQKFKVKVMQLPSLDNILKKGIKVNNLEPILIEDLLSRKEIQPDQNLLKKNISGNNILVTGAGGSIGSELTLQILKLSPSRIILIDMDEFSLYNKINQINILNKNNVEIIFKLGDLKFEPSLEQIFSEYKIDIVFHAAAYKHVPILEDNCIEGVRNNVFSTFNICKLSEKYKVKNVILISSDKAVRPTNIMGCSKRICELIFQSFPRNSSNIKFGIVRFGNVLGSSGSVVPLFNEQLKNGGPITLTHPKIVRYFMSITEASQLVIMASSLTKGKDIFLLDMGEPVLILDLAKKMINLSGLILKDENNPKGDIEIKYSGLRPGEKMYEELLIDSDAIKTEHPLIYRALDKKHIKDDKVFYYLEQLSILINSRDLEGTLKILNLLVPDWRHISKT